MKRFYFPTLMLLVLACSEEDTASKSLQGTWSKTRALYYPDYMQFTQMTERRYFTFSPDGSFESGTTIMDATTNELLGYRGYSTGLSHVKGDTIFISNLVHFSLPDESQLFRDKDELLEYPGESSWKYQYSLSDFNLTLTLEYEPCGPNENCIAAEVFTKE